MYSSQPSLYLAKFSYPNIMGLGTSLFGDGKNKFKQSFHLYNYYYYYYYHFMITVNGIRMHEVPNCVCN